MNKPVSLSAILDSKYAKLGIFLNTFIDCLLKIIRSVRNAFSMMQMQFYFSIVPFAKRDKLAKVPVSVIIRWEEPCSFSRISMIIFMFIRKIRVL